MEVPGPFRDEDCSGREQSTWGNSAEPPPSVLKPFACIIAGSGLMGAPQKTRSGLNRGHVTVIVFGERVLI